MKRRRKSHWTYEGDQRSLVFFGWIYGILMYKWCQMICQNGMKWPIFVEILYLIVDIVWEIIKDRGTSWMHSIFSFIDHAKVHCNIPSAHMNCEPFASPKHRVSNHPNLSYTTPRGPTIRGENWATIGKGDTLGCSLDLSARLLAISHIGCAYGLRTILRNQKSAASLNLSQIMHARWLSPTPN